MSHFFDKGFCVNTPSWHGLEDLLTEYPANLAEALPLGFPRRDGRPGHWEPVAVPVYASQISFDPETGQPVQSFVEVEDFKLIARDDDGTALSVPRNSYEIIGNQTLGEIGEALIEQGAVFDTMFSVRDGAQVGITMLLDEPVLIAGDDSPSVPFLNLNTSHDGSTACRAGLGTVRQVCANTIMFNNMDWDDGTMPSYTFRHTAGALDRIEEAKATIAGAREAFAAFIELSEELATLACSDEQLADFLAGFVPMPEAVDLVTERQRNNILAARGQVRSIYEESLTTNGVRGSALGLVHSAVEYLDHYRAHRSTESLVRRTLLTSDRLKGEAVSLALEVCG